MSPRPRGPFALLVAAVFAAGAVALTVAIWAAPPSDGLGVTAVILLAALSERAAFRLYRDGWVSLGFALVVFAAVWFGPGAAVLVSTAAVISGYLFTDRSREKLFFNFGQANLSAVAGCAAVAPLPPGGEGIVGAAILVLEGLIAGSAMYVVSSLLVASVMAIDQRRSFAEVYWENFAWLLPHYLAVAAASGGFAAVYANLGVPGLVVLTAPLAVSRYAMKQVVDKTRQHVLRLEEANQELRRAYVEIRNMSDELREAYHGTLESLVAALDMRDQETRGHSARVAKHALDIAHMLGIRDPEELEMIYRGALMHDVGKIGVPDAILRKPGPLTEEEWEFMRRHPALGYRILAQVPHLRPAARIVLAHHEYWDGSGYPRGLRGEAIPLGARIFAVCDAFDAIVSDRPYRKGSPPAVARDEILRCAGTQFDPKVVEAFEALFPVWEEEHLSNGAPLYLPRYRAGGGKEEQRRAAG